MNFLQIDTSQFLPNSASHNALEGLKRGSHNAVCQCAWFGIFSPRVDDGKWLVRAIFMARTFE